MIMSSISEHSDTETAHFLATFAEPRWYAAYTRANHEKHVAVHLDSRGVEHFLPLYCSTRRWKDRRVQLELPLFPGYVSWGFHFFAGWGSSRFLAFFAWSGLVED